MYSNQNTAQAYVTIEKDTRISRKWQHQGLCAHYMDEPSVDTDSWLVITPTYVNNYVRIT